MTLTDSETGMLETCRNNEAPFAAATRHQDEFSELTKATSNRRGERLCPRSRGKTSRLSSPRQTQWLESTPVAQVDTAQRSLAVSLISSRLGDNDYPEYSTNQDRDLHGPGSSSHLARGHSPLQQMADQMVDEWRVVQ